MQASGAVEPGTFRYWEMVITVLRGPYRGREFRFTSDSITLGKAPQNDIPLPDETVSRSHVEIAREGRGYLLRDLGSTNGTFLDGSEIREAFLRTGSQVTVGKTRFRFRAVQRRIEAEPYEGSEFEGLVGSTAEMKRAFGLARAVSALDLTVLIQGERGTGRRSLAGAIHRLSPIQQQPSTVVDCPAESPSRLERLLFQTRTGVLERSAGGTVVLVEPTEIPLSLQPRVADAIRNRRRSPPPDLGVGSRSPAPQRFVAATERALEDEVERGRMDGALLDVLDRVRITLPPLRDRIVDVGPLAERFVREAEQGDTPIGAHVIRLMASLGVGLPWAGNVTSLRQTVAAVLELEPDAALQALDGTPLDASPFDPNLTFGENKARWNESFERRYVEWLLHRHSGNVSRASRAAEMDRKHLHRLLKRHGLR